MSITPEDKKMLEELMSGELEEIERKILESLLRAPNGLTRKGLIRVVFGGELQKNLGNDTRDRKIRKGIESLRNHLVLIVSTSGKAGYKLTSDPELIEEMIRELESRIDHLQQKVDAARSTYNLPARIEHDR